jgi:hypothetical protein
MIKHQQYLLKNIMKEIIHLYQLLKILMYGVYSQQLLMKLKVTQIFFLLDMKNFITIKENNDRHFLEIQLIC